jgi:hypothetical protein
MPAAFQMTLDLKTGFDQKFAIDICIGQPARFIAAEPGTRASVHTRRFNTFRPLDYSPGITRLRLGIHQA